MADAPRRQGRPRLSDEEESVDVHLTLSANQYDELYRRAQEDRVSVPERIRRTLRANARHSGDDR